ncbi:MAG: Zn-ribbon domain-containing OB-fold protein [Deltaproteobacteria bacterium]|nr:Zn-ribbon domain-containing OB-fold protein [Deltaproteobacteria bacterium]MCL5276261.1 Zn-ribbon domain-containing OB-fold protein [Deltaproteobacteria bacterium]
MPGETIKSMVPITFLYKNRVGQALETYIGGLKEKKILGIRCPECEKVYVPPRTVCGCCHKKLDLYVEVDQRGTLENFTVAHVTIEGGEIKDAPEPYVIGMIKLEGADSLLSAVVKGLPPEKVKMGAKVKAVWKEPTENNYGDLAYFEIV